jgi:hypothetical protein
VLKDFLTIVPFALKFISRQNYIFSTCRRNFLDHSNLKRDGVTGEWRKLHNEELHNLYSSPDIIRQIKSRRMRWAGHVTRMGEETNEYKVLVGKPEGKRPLGRPRRR